jgi:hypothetical protein
MSIPFQKPLIFALFPWPALCAPKPHHSRSAFENAKLRITPPCRSISYRSYTSGYNCTPPTPNVNQKNLASTCPIRFTLHEIRFTLPASPANPPNPCHLPSVASRLSSLVYLPSSHLRPPSVSSVADPQSSRITPPRTEKRKIVCAYSEQNPLTQKRKRLQTQHLQIPKLQTILRFRSARQFS